MVKLNALVFCQRDSWYYERFSIYVVYHFKVMVILINKPVIFDENILFHDRFYQHFMRCVMLLNEYIFR